MTSDIIHDVDNKIMITIEGMEIPCFQELYDSYKDKNRFQTIIEILFFCFSKKSPYYYGKTLNERIKIIEDIKFSGKNIKAILDEPLIKKCVEQYKHTCYSREDVAYARNLDYLDMYVNILQEIQPTLKHKFNETITNPVTNEKEIKEFEIEILNPKFIQTQNDIKNIRGFIKEYKEEVQKQSKNIVHNYKRIFDTPNK